MMMLGQRIIREGTRTESHTSAPKLFLASLSVPKNRFSTHVTHIFPRNMTVTVRTPIVTVERTMVSRITTQPQSPKGGGGKSTEGGSLNDTTSNPACNACTHTYTTGIPNSAAAHNNVMAAASSAVRPTPQTER